MGKPTGFLEFERLAEGYAPVEVRLKNYQEFVAHLDDAGAKVQGARCMDCGIPFCNSGCPVNNNIPDFNDAVYRGDWRAASEILHSTNNFPEMTGRICPAPCEAACTLGINADPVGIKSLEHAIIDKAGENGWVVPKIAKIKTGKKVAVVGSGPAGLAAAQQLARAGHAVTVFEKNDRIGGLLRYGIPDFKLDKRLIDWRAAQLKAEGVKFVTRTFVGAQLHNVPHGVASDALKVVEPAELLKNFSAVVLAGGAETPRNLPVPGRDLAGVYYALEFLIPQNKEVGGGKKNPLSAKDKHVVVIGGGDTGSDCVGTSNRHGAARVTQFELLPRPPETENKPLVWPYWPTRMRTSSSHDEGCVRDWSIITKEFIGEKGRLKALKCARLEWSGGKMSEVPGSEFEVKADLAFLAMGFTNPITAVLDAFGVVKDSRGNAAATTDGKGCYATSVAKVFAAGDMRRGQSLVVWAIREGRQCARAVDEFLMGTSTLPR
ncbi:MAG: glutamate synthase subunit beta [Gammaproteobacteria bacterium]|nr:glutamate synthase subunit beta [Rhodocyclaceae bacterium]MBU3910735.1 glutamate synthase subunit beta [Gammaproteobacteria bacterium]MBU3988900.1 glutamate synthase subunit beta [Gammaproteobacteria bacterium]MBU4003445.1 glutamate synthase subunit beta [Gammaproteobacteria bacterium]MBU4021915.1 glutamate synthase subunit beta [Gammaproteobacteria bacterium]